MRNLVVALGVLAFAAACTAPAAPPTHPNLTFEDPIVHANGLPDGVTLVTTRFLDRFDQLAHFGMQDNEYTNSAFLRDARDDTWERWAGMSAGPHCGAGCDISGVSPNGQFGVESSSIATEQPSVVVDLATDEQIATLPWNMEHYVPLQFAWRQDSGALFFGEGSQGQYVVSMTAGAVPEPFSFPTDGCEPGYLHQLLSFSSDGLLLNRCIVDPHATNPTFLLLATPADGGPTQQLMSSNSRFDFGVVSGNWGISASWVPHMPGWYVVAEPTVVPYPCGPGNYYPTTIVLKNLDGSQRQVIADGMDRSEGCGAYYAADIIQGWNVANP